MDIIGTWVPHLMGTFTSEGMKYVPIEEYMSAPCSDPREMREKQMFGNMAIEFLADGQMITMMKIPENVTKEEIDAAVAAGEVELNGDYMVREKGTWKEIDGVAYMQMGTETDDAGNEKPHYEPLRIKDDLLSYISLKLKKAE